VKTETGGIKTGIGTVKINIFLFQPEILLFYTI
jgi:hypothetical protein